MIKENQKYINSLLAIIDGICLFISLILTWFIRFRSGFLDIASGHLSFLEYMKPIVFIIPMYLLLYNSFGLYTPRRIKGISNEFVNIIKANVLGILLFTLGLFLIKEIHYSRYFLFIFSISTTILTSFERGILRFSIRKFRKRGYNIKHIFVVGLSELAIEFLKLIEKNRYWGYNVVGIFDDNKNIGYKVCGKEVVGRISDLEKFLQDYKVDDVFITLELKEYEKLGKIIGVCEKMGVRTQIIPDYYRYIPAKPYVEEVEGIPIINIRYVPLDNVVNRTGKRIFDILVSTLCIILFFPVMLLIAAITKITSPGPVLFKQERVGMNRRNFMMYKFRSMKVQDEDEEKNQWTTKDDIRKTKFGQFIRKISLDELPQLLNVLKGDMSLIGPRPERPHFVEQFKEEIPKYMVKHQIRPGMTGWAQINGFRGDTSIFKRIEHDLYYIENWTFGLDIKILWLTLFRGFVNKNAY
jgi:Undecaprenyl-phosphate glucose phosphotransferase